MYSPDDVIPMLLEADPSFIHSWNEHLEFWSDREPTEDDEDYLRGNPRGYYNDAAAFTEYLWQCFLRDKVEQFPAIFEVFEKIIADPDEDDFGSSAYNLIHIGVFEDLLHALDGSGRTESPYTRFDRDVFMPWLGPASRRAWIEAGYHTGIYNDLLYREYALDIEANIDGQLYRTRDSCVLATRCRIRGVTGRWLYGWALYQSSDGAYFIHRVGRHRHFIRPVSVERARMLYEQSGYPAVPVDVAFSTK